MHLRLEYQLLLCFELLCSFQSWGQSMSSGQSKVDCTLHFLPLGSRVHSSLFLACLFQDESSISYHRRVCFIWMLCCRPVPKLWHASGTRALMLTSMSKTHWMILLSMLMDPLTNQTWWGWFIFGHVSLGLFLAAFKRSSYGTQIYI